MKFIIRLVISFIIFLTDVVYRNRAYPRFWVLETYRARSLLCLLVGIAFIRNSWILA